MKTQDEKLERRAAALVIDPISREIELDGGDHQDNYEQDPRHPGGVARGEAFEPFAIDIEHVEERGVDRPAPGGDEGDGKGLKKVDNADNEVEEDDRADQRDGDVES